MNETAFHYKDNNAGWKLELKQVYDLAKLDKSRRPIVIVPGYGMNNFIFGYHPRGMSMEEYCAHAGFEVWSLNLRAQGGSICKGGSRKSSLHDLSVVDLNAAFECVMENTLCNVDKLDAIGCSLGGSMLYVHLALVKESRVESVIAMGGPLRWTEINPVLGMAFRSEWLARHLPIRGTRAIAGVLLPYLKHVPWLLHLYMHPEIVDVDKADQLSKVVEDPNTQLNAEIAHWMKTVDLTIDGTNITEETYNMTNPLYVITGNADGIVPRPTAECALDIVASDVKDLLVVGTDKIKFAHADMFISNYSQEMVFEPIITWLKARYE